MRLLSILLFLGASLSAFAQKPLSTIVSNPDYMIPFQDRLDRESLPFTSSISPIGASGTSGTTTWTVNRISNITYSGVVSSTNATANKIMSMTPNAGRVFYAPYVTVTVSSTVAGLSAVTVSLASTFTNYSVVIPVGSTYTFTNVKVYPGDYWALIVPTGSDSRTVTITADAGTIYDLTDDDRPSIRPKMVGNGDSYTYGTGPILTTEWWFYIVNKYYEGLGYPTRMVSFGEPNKTSLQIVNRLNLGYYRYDYQNEKIKTWMAGINDANIGRTMTTPEITTVVTNLNVWLNERWQLNPKSVAFVFGSPPMSTGYNQVESNLVLVRQALQQAVIDWKTAHPTDTKINFIDFGGSTTQWTTAVFDRTVSANYSADNFHMSKQGSAAVAARITTYIAANPTSCTPTL